MYDKRLQINSLRIDLLTWILRKLLHRHKLKHTHPLGLNFTSMYYNVGP